MFSDRETVPSTELVVAVLSGLDLLRGERTNDVDDLPTRQLLDLVLGYAVLTQDGPRVLERQLTQVCVRSSDRPLRLLFNLLLVGRLVRNPDVRKTFTGFSGGVGRT